MQEIKKTYLYDAFISYSAEDKTFAEKLEEALENYKPPKDLDLPQHRLNIFRYEADMTGTEYYQSIEEHLQNSAKLIVVCSPSARMSDYVNDEIRRFWKLNDPKNIIPIIVAGIPNNEASRDQEEEMAFPEALCEALQMPLAINYVDIDLTKERLNKRLFEGSWYTLLANIYEISRDKLEQRDRKRQRRQRRIIGGVAITVIVALSILTVVALLQRQIAIQRQREAEWQSRISLSRQLAAQAMVELENRPQRSLLLAVEANCVKWNGQFLRIQAAEQTLRQVLSEVGGLPFGSFESAVEAAAFSPDGRWLAVAGGGEYEDHMALLVDISKPNPRALLLRGHRGPVIAVAFSPDCRWLATGSMDCTVRLWNMKTEDPSAESVVLAGPETWVLALAFSPDSHWLASASGNIFDVLTSGGSTGEALVLWDLRKQYPEAQPTIIHWHEDDVTDVEFSNDGRWLATSSRDGGVRLWTANEDGLRIDPVVLWAQSKGVWGLMISFSPDSHWLVSGNTGSAKLWDLTANVTERPPADLRHEGDVTDVAFTSDSRFMATACADGLVRLWELASIGKRQPRTFRRHQGAVTAVDFSLDGRWLLTGSRDNTAQLWDLSASDPSLRPVILKGHESGVTSVAFSPDNFRAVTGSHDGSARLWNFRTNPSVEPIILHGYTGSVSTCSFSYDNRQFAFGTGGSRTMLLDLTVSDPASGWSILPAEPVGADFVSFSPNNRWLVTIGCILDYKVRLWELSDLDGSPLVLAGEAPYVEQIVFSMNGSHLITMGGPLDRTARRWDLKYPGDEPAVLKLGDRYNALALSSDGHWLAGVSKEGAVNVWDMTLPEVPAVPLELKGHVSSVIEVAFSRDNHILAAGAKDGTVRIWSLQGADWAEEPVVLYGHKGVVRALDFGESGHYIATGGNYIDLTIRLWDIANPEKELLTLHGHDDGVIDIALRTDVGRLASVSSVGIVRLWDIGGSDPSARPIIIPREAVSGADEWGARTVTFSPDGHYLVTASGPDGKAELWRISIDGLVNLARRTAGRSLTEDERLRYLGAEQGIKHVVIATYANAFSSYTTTHEEYEEQYYEGASTLFGPWTFKAYEQENKKLAAAMKDGLDVPGGPEPEDIPVDKIKKSKAGMVMPDYKLRSLGLGFGEFDEVPKSSYRKGETVKFSFVSGYPNRDLKTGGNYFKIEKEKPDDTWKIEFTDDDFSTQMHWFKMERSSMTRIEWKIQDMQESGTYRIVYDGPVKKKSGGEIESMHVEVRFTVE